MSQESCNIHYHNNCVYLSLSSCNSCCFPILSPSFASGYSSHTVWRHTMTAQSVGMTDDEGVGERAVVSQECCQRRPLCRCLIGHSGLPPTFFWDSPNHGRFSPHHPIVESLTQVTDMMTFTITKYTYMNKLVPATSSDLRVVDLTNKLPVLYGVDLKSVSKYEDTFSHHTLEEDLHRMWVHPWKMR